MAAAECKGGCRGSTPSRSRRHCGRGWRFCRVTPAQETPIPCPVACSSGVLMKSKAKQKPTLGMEIAVDLLGDRWSLLILRNMVLRETRSFKELLESCEGIATNILSTRLRKLLTHKIISVRREPSDRRKLNYCLTSKGKHLAPVLTEMALWTARHSTAARRKGDA